MRTGPLLLSAAILAAGVGAIGWWHARRTDGLRDIARSSPPPAPIVARSAQRDVGWLDDAGRPPATDPGVRWPASAFQRAPLPPATVAEIYRLEDLDSLFDAWAAHRGAPWHELEVEWNEHPRGKWSWTTDALGLRRDREPSAAAPVLRVVVAGDSHTDGVCDNADSFCTLAELEIARRRPGESIEVVNAGRSSSTFANYLGVLERMLALEPDVFVMVVYGGNDFAEALVWQRLVQGIQGPRRTPAERDRRDAAVALHPAAVAQVFGQLDELARSEPARELALQTARDVTTEVRNVCARFGIRLVVAYLPPPSDVEWARHAGTFDAIARTLELDAAALATTEQLADSYLAFVRDAGIEALDLRPVLRGAHEAQYWQGDLHTALTGHRRIASALAPVLEAGGAPRPRARRAPGVLRAGLPQWADPLAPGAPRPPDWAEWSRGSTEAVPRHVARGGSSIAPAVAGDDDELDPRVGVRYRAGLDVPRKGELGPWQLRTGGDGGRAVPGSSDAPEARRVLVLGGGAVDSARDDAARLPAALVAAWSRLHRRSPLRVRDASHASSTLASHAASLAGRDVARGETVLLVVDVDTDFAAVLDARGEPADATVAAGVAAVRARGPIALTTSALASLARFGRDEALAERAGELALEETLAVDAAVRAAGGRLVVVCVPPAVEIDALELAAPVRGACAALGLEPRAQSILPRAARSYVAALQAAGVDAFDVGLCVAPHPGRLIHPRTGSVGVALATQIGAVCAHLVE